MSLDKLKRVRRGHRAFVTKTISSVNEICQGYSGSLLEKEKLQGYKSTLTEKKTALQQQDNAIIEQLDKDEEINADIFESSELGESISRALVKIDLILNSNDNNSLGTSNFSKALPESESIVKSKLPKLTLKRFVSKVDKFNYLRSLLDGAAASAIEGFSLTKENYDAAVNLLKDRFANTQVIISSHMDALLKLNAIVDMSELSKIRGLYDKIETHVRSLQNLGISSESYGSLLIPVIVNKLPVELQLVISRKLDKANWDVEKFMEEFKTELEARERCNMINSSHPTTKSDVLLVTRANYQIQHLPW